MDRGAEIAQINHELEILRERHATYERSDRMLRAFFAWLPIVFLPVVAIIFYQDPEAGLVVGGLAIFMCLIAFLHYTLGPKTRAIVTAVASFGISHVGRISDVQLIEEQIAEREQRLAELTPS